MFRRLLRSLALGFSTLALVHGANASGLQIAPVTLDLSRNANAEGIWLTNTANTPLHAQVRVFLWTQKDGVDMLTPSTGLTVSPPLLEIEPGAQQLLRVIRTSASPEAGTEVTYRLIVDELPLPTSPEKTSKPLPNQTTVGVNFVMRYSLPVFVGDVDPTAAAQQLDWSLVNTAGQWSVRVRNSGQAHAQVADLQGETAKGETLPLREGLVGYVLAGSTMEWRLPSSAHPNQLRGFKAMINQVVQPVHVRPAP